MEGRWPNSANSEPAEDLAQILAVVVACPGCSANIPFRLNDLDLALQCPQCSAWLKPEEHFPSRSEVIDSIIEQADGLSQTKPETSIRLLQWILHNDPYCSEAHHLMGIIQDEQNGDHALEHLQFAVELNPRRAKYHYDLGVAHFGRENFFAARPEFERALEILPDFLYAIKNLMVCYAQLEEPIAAYVAGDRVMTLDRHGRHGTAARDYLEHLPIFDDPAKRVTIDKLCAAFELQEKNDFSHAADLFLEIMNSLSPESPGHSMMLEHVAVCRLEQHRYHECFQLSQMARRALPCVGALVLQPYSESITNSSFHDAIPFYKDLIQRLFDVEPVCVQFDFEIVNGRAEKQAVILAPDGSWFRASRAGNLVRVADPNQTVVEDVIWEDNYLAFEGI